MEKISQDTDLIETSELAQLLDSKKPNIRIIDGAMFPPGDPRNGLAEYKKEHIPGAFFFDSALWTDKTQKFPNKTPTEAIFIENCKKMRIRKSDLIICYDHLGILGGARAWFIFRMFGAENVKILNGGLQKWKNEKRKTEQSEKPIELPLDPDKPGDYDYKKNNEMIVNIDKLYQIIADLGHKKSEAYILDARPAEKFNGTVPETRPGLRLGHMPFAINIPYKEFSNPDGTQKSIEDTKKVFEKYGVNIEKPIIASCQQGTTSCNILHALKRLGKKDLVLYDGGWNEYGSLPEPDFSKINA